MNRRNFLGTLSAVPLAKIVTAVEAEATPSGDSFVSIFNGRDLDGWTITEGPESAFSVADGAIVVNDSASYPTWLRSNRQYENFDFRAEFYMKGLDRFRHLPARSGEWAPDLGWHADQAVPSSGRKADVELRWVPSSRWLRRGR